MLTVYTIHIMTSRTERINLIGKCKKLAYQLVIVGKFGDNEYHFPQIGYSSLKNIITDKDLDYTDYVSADAAELECLVYFTFIPSINMVGILDNTLVDVESIHDFLSCIKYLLDMTNTNSNENTSVDPTETRKKLYITSEPSIENTTTHIEEKGQYQPTDQQLAEQPNQQLAEQPNQQLAEQPKVAPIDEPFSMVSITGGEEFSFSISESMNKKIETFIASYLVGDSIWQALASKKDYAYNLFERRYWPYSSTMNKDKIWKHVNENSVRDDYPREITGESDDAKEYRLEMAVAKVRNNNNFAAYEVPAPHQYGDFTKDLNIVEHLININKNGYAIELLFRLCMNPNRAHIIKHEKFWKLCQVLFHTDSIAEENMLLYLLHFPLYILCHEESILFTKVPMKSRIILSSDEAARFMKFKGIHIQRNPYVQVMTGNNPIELTTPFYNRDTTRECNDQKTFDRYFKWMTNDAFQGIDFDEYKIAASGSVVRACRTKVSSQVADYKRVSESYYVHPLDIKRKELKMTWEEFFQTDIFIDIPLPSPKDYESIEEIEKYNAKVAAKYSSGLSKGKYVEPPKIKHASSKKSRKEDNDEDDLDGNSDSDSDVKPKPKPKSKRNKTPNSDSDSDSDLSETDELIIAKPTKSKAKPTKSKAKPKAKPKATKSKAKPKAKAKVTKKNTDSDSDAKSDSDADLKNNESEEDSSDSEDGIASASAMGEIEAIPRSPGSMTFAEYMKAKDVKVIHIKTDENPESPTGEPSPVFLDYKNELDFIDDKSSEEMEKHALLAVSARYHPGYESLSDSEFKLICTPPDKLGQYVKPRHNPMADVDVSVHVNTYAEYEKIAYALYSRIAQNCAVYGPVWMQRIPTTNSSKFRIYGPGLPRDIDLFMVGSNRTPARLVKAYHLDCVHSWYDGKITYSYIGCILSDITGLNRTYKWFSCAKTPGDIVMKYCERSVSIPLNINERKTLEEYIKLTPTWKALFEGKYKDMAIWGAVYVNHPLFHADYFGCGIKANCRQEAIVTNFSEYAHYNRLVTWVTEYGETLARYNEECTHIIPPNIRTIKSYIHYATSK